jgi:hypothetical protein
LLAEARPDLVANALNLTPTGHAGQMPSAAARYHI